MIILIFGVTNVGKTETGNLLAKKLDYKFYDLDLEIKRFFSVTLDEFMERYPYSYERGEIKAKLVKKIIDREENNIVITVSPIFHSEIINSLINLENVFAIELQDSTKHIFERLVFADENDIIYKDDEYKEKHRDYYINDIEEDIIESKILYRNISCKYFMNNNQVEKVVDDLLLILEDINNL